MSRLKQMRGFTLIELMIVVAVIGILSAIAYPSYMDSVRKSRRTDGQSALLDAAQKMEVFYARNATYTTTEADLNPPLSGVSPEGYYDINIQNAIAACPITACYRLRATAGSTGGQDQDRVSHFRLWSTGRKQHRLSGGGWGDGWTVP
ncbi:MAG: type IV pilin protein [Gammaproteobacteria bacterium]|nr:type IV pilin protein [Gammaproteobacteria bacterium]